MLLRNDLDSRWCTTDKDAINKLSPGDAVIIFTPDSELHTLLND